MHLERRITINMTTKEKIEDLLTKAFSISHLEIIDESQKHKGHAGARESGGGHYIVTIVSDDFKGMMLLKRHRTVKDALKELFPNQIHALSIKAITPNEALN